MRNLNESFQLLISQWKLTVAMQRVKPIGLRKAVHSAESGSTGKMEREQRTESGRRGNSANFKQNMRHRQEAVTYILSSTEYRVSAVAQWMDDGPWAITASQCYKGATVTAESTLLAIRE
jgi:hypothetical protein